MNTQVKKLVKSTFYFKTNLSNLSHELNDICVMHGVRDRFFEMVTSLGFRKDVTQVETREHNKDFKPLASLTLLSLIMINKKKVKKY